MKKILLIVSVLLITPSVFSQQINKKLNIYAAYNIGNFSGEEMSDDNGFIFPNLYSNMSELNGYSLKANYKILPLFSIGLEGGEMSGTNWSSENKDLYNGAEVRLKSISPVFQIHNRFKETGIFNQLKLFGEVSPVFGQSKLQLEKPIFEINSVDGIDMELLESIDNYFGIKGCIGIEYAFSKDVGLKLSYSIQKNNISSALYNDADFVFGQMSIGLFFRFLYNKSYTY
jgi:opacity protein-like surface antigen